MTIRGGRTPFDNVYDQPDPRAFFASLRRFDYQTPQHAQPVFRRLVTAQARSRPVTVADLCCSYGVNAALLNYRLTLDDLYARYTSPRIVGLTTTELIEQDRDFYAAHRLDDAVPVIGLDIATSAIDYAVAVGLLDAGFAENLEMDTASPELLLTVHPVSLITITGGVSFLTARTFHTLLRAAADPVWVAAFVLRTGSYHPIAAALAEHGLVTEVDQRHTVVQRRFTDPDEQHYAVTAVRQTGADPAGKETAGSYHTAIHLPRLTDCSASNRQRRSTRASAPWRSMDAARPRTTKIRRPRSAGNSATRTSSSGRSADTSLPSSSMSVSPGRCRGSDGERPPGCWPN